MNLIWLKYVSYACLVGAAFCYFSLRMNWWAPSRIWKLCLFVACIVLACTTWHVQEENTRQHSPRKLVIGTVAWVNPSVSRGGYIDDDFQLKIGSGAVSPRFSDVFVGSNKANQPIHIGDTLGVLYRTRDNFPLSVDVLQGQRGGRRYHRIDEGNGYIFGVAFAGSIAFLGLLVCGKYSGRRTYPSESTSLNLND